MTAKRLLTAEEQDNCVASKEQLDAFLAEPDDRVAAKLRQELSSEVFKLVAKIILYGDNIAKAQLAKVDRPSELMQKAISVIEGSLILDEPEDKRLAFIYRMAHVGRGECEHPDWIEEMEMCYQQLLNSKVISPIAIIPKVDEVCPECGLCGGEMVRNPHAEAGHPQLLLEVGAVWNCVACTQKSLHGWAERAMKAEGELENPTCQGKKDRPDREKIDSIVAEIISVTELTTLNTKELTSRQNTINHLRIVTTNKIIALMPDEKEIRKQERERICGILESHTDSRTWVEVGCIFNLSIEEWQALKGNQREDGND